MSRVISRRYGLRALAFMAVAVLSIPRPALCGEVPKNIILLIGDGMGVAHLTLGQIATGGLNAERMPVGGLIKTFPFGGMVTDSAASGTAMTTGHKTRNGMISISPDGDTLTTVFEYAEERGMSTGLVATSSITHATPAVFITHVVDRGMEAEIARQMAGSGLDLMIGGGWSFFVPGEIEGSRRPDELDLIAILKERMPVVRSAEELMRLEGTASAAAFLAPRECPPAMERSYTLADLASAAIRILSAGENGFILMVEGSQIDWAAHDNDDSGILYEMKDFDGAVGSALDFAESDGRTLVIMTSDHETGGLGLNEPPLTSSRVVAPAFTTDDHTMEMVPILAFGPGSEAFGGIHDNTFIGITLIEHVRK
jgi:alkaline phosphatase